MIIKPGADMPSPLSVSRTEADIGNSGPALLTNKFIVSVGPVTKIIFMEQGNPIQTPSFRTAVVMATQDAIALKNLLIGMLTETEKQIRSFEPPQSEPPTIDKIRKFQ